MNNQGYDVKIADLSELLERRGAMPREARVTRYVRDVSGGRIPLIRVLLSNGETWEHRHTLTNGEIQHFTWCLRIIEKRGI